MSVPGDSVASMGANFDDDPWAEARSIGDDLTIYIVDLPTGLLGFCDHDTRTIWLANGMTQRQRRAVLKHELQHLKRGRVSANAHFASREEHAVEVETAFMLIPISRLLAALRWTRDVRELAEELHVPVDLVAVRLCNMNHPAERAAVKRICADLDELIAP